MLLPTSTCGCLTGAALENLVGTLCHHFKPAHSQHTEHTGHTEYSYTQNTMDIHNTLSTQYMHTGHTDHKQHIDPTAGPLHYGQHQKGS